MHEVNVFRALTGGVPMVDPALWNGKPVMMDRQQIGITRNARLLRDGVTIAVDVDYLPTPEPTVIVEASR